MDAKVGARGEWLEKSNRFQQQVCVCACVLCHDKFEDYQEKGADKQPFDYIFRKLYYINAYRLRESCAQICYRYIRSNLHDGIRMNWSAYERIPLKSCVTCDDVLVMTTTTKSFVFTVRRCVCMCSEANVTWSLQTTYDGSAHKRTRTDSAININMGMNKNQNQNQNTIDCAESLCPKIQRMVSHHTQTHTIQTPCKWIYFVRCFVAKNFQKLCLSVNMCACVHVLES